MEPQKQGKIPRNQCMGGVLMLNICGGVYEMFQNIYNLFKGFLGKTKKE